jgi:hypothetical protein
LVADDGFVSDLICFIARASDVAETPYILANGTLNTSCALPTGIATDDGATKYHTNMRCFSQSKTTHQVVIDYHLVVGPSEC